MIKNVQAISEIHRVGAWFMPDRSRMRATDLRIVAISLLPAPLFAPIFSRKVQEFIDVVFQIPPAAVESFGEEVYQFAEESLRQAILWLDGFLARSMMLPSTRRRLVHQRNQLQEAVYAISRGYAPGHVPSREEQEALAGRHLHAATTVHPR